MRLRPIRRFVLLVDDPEGETLAGGVVVRTGMRRTCLDYTVLRVGTEEKAGFGQGDRVVLRTPDAGRKLRIDGVPVRLVRISDVIGVVE